MHILSVGRALPEHRYPQDEITRALVEAWSGSPGVARRLEAFHRAVDVEQRHFAMPREAYAAVRDFGARNDVYIREGLALGEAAIREALARAGLDPADVDVIFTVSVTGVAVPTLDARLVSRLGLRPDVKRVPIFGLGCVAGAAGIARVHDYLRAWPDQVAVLLAVELCSLTLQAEDRSIANLIGSGLFADGAAAVVGVGSTHPAAARGEAPTVVSTRSRLYPESEDAMGWSVSSDGFRLLLSREVPDLVRRHLRADVEDFLAEAGLRIGDVDAWLAHPGGPRVLSEAQKALGLSDDAFEASRRSLREVGNLSSASILFILGDTLEERRVPEGSDVLLFAMGPGFCAELVRIEW